MEALLQAGDEWFTSALDLNAYDEATALPLTHFSHVSKMTLLFLCALFLGKAVTKGKGAVQLGFLPAAHNFFLSAISGIMVIGTALSLWQAGSSLDDGFCTPGGKFTESLKFWVYIYYISKFYEYLDTMILVLSKKPLSFLQLYHHTVVPFIIWTWARSDIVFCTMGLLFNAFVHFIMYYYFGIMSCRSYLQKNSKVPLKFKRIWWKKYITLLQIAQFVSSLILGGIYTYKTYTVPNCGGWEVFLFTTFFNVTFLFLFIDLFKSSNARPEPAAQTPKVPAKTE